MGLPEKTPYEILLEKIALSLQGIDASLEWFKCAAEADIQDASVRADADHAKVLKSECMVCDYPASNHMHDGDYQGPGKHEFQSPLLRP